MGNNERKPYTREEHLLILGHFQDFVDAFHEAIKRDETLTRLSDNEPLYALRLDRESRALFALTYTKIGRQIGWLELQDPDSGEKLIHVQTYIEEPDNVWVADSTKWTKDGSYENHGHIQAEVTVLAVRNISRWVNDGIGIQENVEDLQPVENLHDLYSEPRMAALQEYTRLLTEPGVWIAYTPREN